MRPILLLVLAAAVSRSAQHTPQSVYEEGQRYWNLSLAAFKDLETQAPDSGYASALLGEARAEERRYTAALDAFAAAVRQIPRLRGVRASMANVQLEEGNTAEASQSQALEQQLGPPDCSSEKIWCDFTAGEFDAVIEEADTRPAPERLYWLAKAYRELALRTFSQLDTFADSSELHEVKAKLLQNEHHYADAVRELRAALVLRPADPNLQRELATALFLTENYSEILPELEELLKREPKSANLNFFVGDSLLETDHAQEAAPYLETALTLDPNLTPAHVALGMCYAHLGNDLKALPHLEAGIGLDTDGRVHYLLARAYKKAGQLGRAQQMMNEYKQIKAATGASK